MVHFQRRCEPFRPVQAAFGHIRSRTTRPALAGPSAMKSGHGELANRLGDVVPSFAERAPVQVRGRQRAKVETHHRGRRGRRPLLTENRRNQSRPPRAWHGRRCQLPVTTVRTPHATGPTSPVLARPAPRCALVRTFLQQREGRSFSRHFKMTKRGADNDLENEDNGKLVAGAAVGSVTIPIFFSPTRVNVSSSASPPYVPAMARGKPNIRPMRAARTGFAISPRGTLATSFRRSGKCPRQDYVNFMRAPFLPPA